MDYGLTFSTLTEDLGEIVHTVTAGSIVPGAKAYYLVQSKVAGSFEAAIAPGAGFQGETKLQILDPRDPSHVLATSADGSSHVIVAVDAGQQLLVSVVGDDSTSGDFFLELSNHDQFNTGIPDSKTLFFPEGFGPSEVAVANLNPGDDAGHDRYLDLVVSDTALNVVSVLMGNGDGTFGAPRQIAVGAFAPPPNKPKQVGRAVAVADFDGDGNPDIVVTNIASSDVSVLFGNGDGTFQPQRRFNASAAPFALAVGNLNSDVLDINGNPDQVPDLVVVDSSSHALGKIAILLGRPDRTFAPPVLIPSPLGDDVPFARVRIADFNRDGKNDLLVASDGGTMTHVLLGNGDGTFQPSQDFPSFGPGVAIADLDGDQILDVVEAHYATNDVGFSLGTGDGTFVEGQTIATGQAPVAVAVADYTGDGVPDLIVANSGINQPLFQGPPTVVLLQGLTNEDGSFAGFDSFAGGDAQVLATLKFPHDLQTADLDGDGSQDVIVADRDGIFVIFGKSPTIARNNTLEAARDLGAVVHTVQPTLTITPDDNDAWFKLRVPTEPFNGGVDEVLDFSGGFTNESTGGLMMEVVDDAGNIVNSGDRFRVVAHQGEELYVHIFGASDSVTTGTGAYTLSIDTLPQLIGVNVQNLLPGTNSTNAGPTTSLTLLFQGDRLDAASAESAGNYKVIWLGPNGVEGGGDDQEFLAGPGLPAGSRAAVYNPGSNVDIASGRAVPLLVRQTVTLFFAQPLPEGNFEVIVTPGVTSAAFNSTESQLVSPRTGFTLHPVVNATNGDVKEGAQRTVVVRPVGAVGDLRIFEAGNSFLSQFRYDLGALLDTLLANAPRADDSSDATITDQLLQQIKAAFGAALGPSGRPLVPVLVLFLDPPSSYLIDPAGLSANNDLHTDSFSNNLRRAFVGVGSNVDLFVFASPNGEYHLNLSDVPPQSRGGIVFFGNQGAISQSLTKAIQEGQSSFTFQFESLFIPSPSIASRTSAAIHTDIVGSFRSTTFSATERLLLLSSASLAALATENGADPNSGGAITRNWLENVGSAWADLEALWSDMDQDLHDDREQSKNDSAPNAAEKQTALRVWSAFENVWDDLFGGKEDKPPHLDREVVPASHRQEATNNSEDEHSAQDDSKAAATDSTSSDDASSASSQPSVVMPEGTDKHQSSKIQSAPSAAAENIHQQGSEPHAPAA
jgi:hypothetical protein